MTAEVLRYAAFTEDGRGGNPAGVVLDAACLEPPQMLAIAEAIGYSETAFVSPAGAGTYDVRYFSPHAEVAFCGHATVATAVAMAQRNGVGHVHFHTMAGPVDVSTVLEDGQVTATLTSPPAHTRPIDDLALTRTLTALRWTGDDVDPHYPPRVAHAGNDHPVLAAATSERLANLDYDYDALAAVMADEGWTTVCLFRPLSRTELEVRNPFPPGGVVEDPATGAAAAALGGYLRDLDLVPGDARLWVHQGHHMGAPSRLVVDLDPSTRSVRVSGTATRLALSPYDEPGHVRDFC
jgi:PhzF family phenazine biosynthesis protein